MSSHQLKRGTYATTATYAADAQEFAKANGIHTPDRSEQQDNFQDGVGGIELHSLYFV